MRSIIFARHATTVLLTASVAMALRAEGPAAPPSGDPAAWVQQRVQRWQPTAAERRFDDIGWVPDILEARRLAEQHQRPIFLFTHDGHMAVGRC